MVQSFFGLVISPAAGYTGLERDCCILQGQWNITAGQNDLFDAFDCQKHYFRVDEPGVLHADINWRVQKNDGDFIERSAVQTFKQVPIISSLRLGTTPFTMKTLC